MQCFLLATLRHFESHPDLVRKLWTSVGRERANVRFVFEQLLAMCVRKQSAEFVALAKHIAIYLGMSRATYIVANIYFFNRAMRTCGSC